ncbi:MAG: hypothetical protein PHF84_01630 [bacterium]|nr:hypothetical protein [bacterium]
MKKIIFILICPCFIVLGTSPLFSQETNSLLKQAQEQFDRNDYQKATDIYKEVLKADPGNYLALWKLSHCYVNMGASTEDETKKEALFNTSADWARKAIHSQTNQADGYAMLSIAEGRLAMFVGGKRQVVLSRNIKANAMRAIQIDPQHDGALHVLGVWHREVATLGGFLKFFANVLYGGLPKASIEESILYLKRAVEVAPDNLEHHLDLGKSYIEADKEKEARREFQAVISQPAQEAYDQDLKKEAKELLEDLD